MNLDQVLFTKSYSLHADITMFRVQRGKKHHQGDRVGALHLAPPGLLNGRFDLVNCRTAYFALAPDTACYEAVCRREAQWLSVAELRQRELIAMRVVRPLNLLSLLTVSSFLPGLQSLRFGETQSLAAQAHAEGFDGVAYLSSQQHLGTCVALFGGAMLDLKRVSRSPLIRNSSGELHPALGEAVCGSGIPLTP